MTWEWRELERNIGVTSVATKLKLRKLEVEFWSVAANLWS